MEKVVFSLKKLYKKNTLFALCFVVITLVLAPSFYSIQVFAQIGLAPIPTFQKTVPTYIIDIPPGAVSANISSHFVPGKISIPSGTTIAWFNDDPGQTHTVTSGLPKSPDAGKLFNSGVMPEGSFYQYTFDNAGTYRYHCTLHPYMAGTINVGNSSETGHYFKFKSGAYLSPDNNNIASWTVNKTQYDRTLLDFKPLNIAIDDSIPVAYNLKISNASNASNAIFDNNFLALGGNGLQVELISGKLNKTNVYGPDVTDPIVGAYHAERNFADGNYKITLQLVSIGSQQISNIMDEFGLRFVS
jgi:plastocyanin